jgi:signal transduction histidine kinase/ligand-binding sensor domain-containing protein
MWRSFAASVFLLCVSSVTEAKPVAYEVSNLEENWQQGTVTAIVQSHEGYLWLGSFHGLARFDGVRFTVFTSGTTAELANGLITSLLEDDQGNLWIGHETGNLSKYRDGEFTAIRFPVAWPGGSIEAIGEDEAHDIWLLNNKGVLVRVRDGKTTRCPGNSSTLIGRAFLARSPDRRLWVVSNGVAAIMKNGAPEPFQFDDDTGGLFYEQLAPARNGGLWVLGGGRLRQWKDGKWTKEVEGFPKEPGAISLITEAQSGALLAGTLRHGLFILNPDSSFRNFSHTNGLSQDWVRTLCQDHEGNLWVGTGSGVDALRPRKVNVLNAPDKWGGCGVLSLAFESSGAAWIGTEGAGLYRYREDQWQNFGPAQGVSNLFVWSVCATRDNRLLAGTWGGGLLQRDGTEFQIPSGLSRLTAPVLAMYEAKGDALWIGTTEGLKLYERGEIKWSVGKDKLLLPDVRSILETADGTIWFGMSGGGLGRLNGGTLKQFLKSDGPGSDFIVCLHEDSTGALWYGTSDHGLGRWKGGKFSSITTAQGLPSDVICHLIEDGLGFLWMSSHGGIVRASIEDLNRCADGIQPIVPCLVYGRSTGLPALTCSGGFQPGAARAADGRIWFPTPKGVAIVDPTQITINRVPPPVLIEELAADSEVLKGKALNIPGGSTLQIAPGKTRFEIQYTALSFTAPDEVRFRYRLEGLEQDWVEARTRRVAEYSYLKPGHYVFRVKACNNDNVWNDQGATLAFIVQPFFWQTAWFQAAILAAGASLLALSIFWGTRRRLRRKLENLERQRALERERSRIARDIHDDLGASLTRINMLSQSVRSELEANHSATGDVEAIYATARELTRAMDEIVWAVNPKHDTLDSLVNYLGRYAQSYLNAAGLRCRLDVPLHPPSWTLTAEVRHNLFLALKEALNNVVKNAHAAEVRISLTVTADQFALVIADDGQGFEPGIQNNTSVSDGAGRISSGNGLPNMRKRLEEIGGSCRVQSSQGEGTTVELTVPFSNTAN